MSPPDPFAACEALLRKADYDRYLAALFAPAAARPHLVALYAFNYEIARTAESVSQPVMGQIRLQWWREAIEELYAGRTRAHEVVTALGEAVRVHALPRALFDAVIDAREADLDEAPFADLASMQTYAEATSGHVMQLAARILGADGTMDAAAREAGIAYALTGLLRALPFSAARRHLVLPTGMLRAKGLSSDDIFAGEASPGLTAVIAAIAGAARAHLAAARALPAPRKFLPALLPAATAPFYLNVLTRPGFDPFRDASEVPVFRRQFAMLGGMMRGRA